MGKEARGPRLTTSQGYNAVGKLELEFGFVYGRDKRASSNLTATGYLVQKSTTYVP